ncbi:hypothetical protein IV203_009460 [Nitzschia inconspicua]|uniref:Reverse transcriptase zinc-binding domain-containing protein n=1 Tax=Nitzschia inconspicua TaxID=303405 RepID=A0A9K3KVR8_9STRA|nr:hypothetical protein IV203_009460 [Nitzschia inconspicua]
MTSAEIPKSYVNDWQSHERSVNTFKDGPDIFLVKFLQGWLPVGKLVSRYIPVKYPSACPFCDEPVEDSKHFLTCPNPERRKWHAALETSLRHRCESVDTDPALLDLLLRGLNHWLQGTPIPAHRTRNSARHGKDAEDKAQGRPETAHRSIRDLYDLKPRCSLQAQRHHFYPKVKDHFHKDTDARSLENWLETYQPMITQNIRHRRNNSDRRLRQIDDVFHLIRIVPPRDPTPTMALRQHTPTLTTRPINTYFRPHRITSPTPILETPTTTARTTSTSNNPTTPHRIVRCISWSWLLPSIVAVSIGCSGYRLEGSQKHQFGRYEASYLRDHLERTMVAPVTNIKGMFCRIFTQPTRKTGEVDEFW